MNQNEVERALGKPDVEELLADNYSRWYFLELGLSVSLVNAPGKSAVVTSLHKTRGWYADRLQVGDSESDVQTVLGKAEGVQTPITHDTWLFADREGSHVGITLKDGKVAGFFLSLAENPD